MFFNKDNYVESINVSTITSANPKAQPVKCTARVITQVRC